MPPRKTHPSPAQTESEQASIHPTAVVAPDARLGQGVVVEPYAVIDPNVEIGAGTRIGPHAVVRRYVRMGTGNVVHAHAILGDEPQDVSFEGQATWVDIGDDNVFREGVTVHRSTNAERPTRIGSRCYLMAYAHVGHDCSVGNGVILTNNVCLGGHVEVGNRCTIGGGALVHQFARIGAHAMVAGFLAIRRDVLPYALVGGDPVRHYKLNRVGLTRAGIEGDRYRALEKAFRALRAGETPATADTPEVGELLEWLAAPSKRGRYGFA